jgi:fibronectin-binding autotransporter adhesin
MASTNLQQWNPTAVNQETDAQYAADSTRAGGAVDPAIFLSVLGNKAFYQWSTYLTALFQAFANKGFTTSDSSLNTLTAQCANFLTTADTLPPIQSVAYSSTPTFNAGAASGFQMTLTGNVTGITITGVAPGELIAIEFIQDGTGGRTVNGWPTLVTNTAAIPQPDLSPGIGTLYLFRVELNGNVHPAAPAISGNGTYVTNLTAADTVTGGALVVTGNGRVVGTLTVNGVATFTNNVQVNAALGVTGNVTAGGVIATNTQTNNNANVNGTTTTGALSVTGSANVASNLLVGSRLTAGSLTLSSPGSSGQVLTNVGGVFVPEAVPAQTATRNDVTGSRSFGTTYTNSSGGVMYVTGYGNTRGSAVGSVACFVNGDADFANTATATIDGGACGFSFVVPSGGTYQIQANTLASDTGVTGVGKWIETVVS